ncbi:hypothetical protein OKW41_007144 [Paraburkholderia sp. UCT70]|uniref:hypothetical protein n=1 Tax=Paraburkholderia sp. UCT70 TaxID=2991068 RepID=UPI003D212D9A
MKDRHRKSVRAARLVGAFREALRRFIAATAVLNIEPKFILNIEPKFNVAGANCKDKFCRESDKGADDFHSTVKGRIVSSLPEETFFGEFLATV